jgi:lipopolysaccharide/colanic/teichoic acid biosynthesis glycosyltransferase
VSFPLVVYDRGGIRVEDVNTVYERLTGKLLVEDLRPSWLIFSDDSSASRWTRRSKRVFDIVLALVGLVVSTPFMVYEQRHAVKPGLTGWAQVKYRYGASFEDSLEKLRYDLYYVKPLSIPFDLTILFDTVKVVLFANGAR